MMNFTFVPSKLQCSAWRVRNICPKRVTSHALGVSQITLPVKNTNGRYIVQELHVTILGTFFDIIDLPEVSAKVSVSICQTFVNVC